MSCQIASFVLADDALIVKDLRMRRSLVKLLGVVKAVTKMVTRCLRMTIVAMFVVCNENVF